MLKTKRLNRVVSFALIAAFLVGSSAGCKGDNNVVTEETVSQPITTEAAEESDLSSVFVPTQTEEDETAQTEAYVPDPINISFEPEFGTAGGSVCPG